MNKENKGALFKAKTKKTEKSPDYYGTINLSGYEYKIAGWLTTSKDGNQKYISLSINDCANQSDFPPMEDETDDQKHNRKTSRYNHTL